MSAGDRRPQDGHDGYLPRHLAVAGSPAPAEGTGPRERGELSYQSARREADKTISGDNAEAAFRAAIRCLREADKLIIQVRVERSRAHEEDANLQKDKAAMAAERRRLTRLREELAAERARLAADRTALQATRETRRRPRETAPGAVPDLDASLRPDPRDTASPAAFMSMLRQFKIWSGNPGLRQIAAGSGNRYSASALHTALHAGHLPRKHEVVDAIVQGCGGSEEDRRMWATAWRQLAMQPGSGVPLARVIDFPEAGTMATAAGQA